MLVHVFKKCVLQCFYFREVLPLSLLAFKACCQVFSLKRRQEENFQEVIDHLTGNGTLNTITKSKISFQYFLIYYFCQTLVLVWTNKLTDLEHY